MDTEVQLEGCPHGDFMHRRNEKARDLFVDKVGCCCHLLPWECLNLKLAPESSLCSANITDDHHLSGLMW